MYSNGKPQLYNGKAILKNLCILRFACLALLSIEQFVAVVMFVKSHATHVVTWLSIVSIAYLIDTLSHCNHV